MLFTYDNAHNGIARQAVLPAAFSSPPCPAPLSRCFISLALDYTPAICLCRLQGYKYRAMRAEVAIPGVCAAAADNLLTERAIMWILLLIAIGVAIYFIYRSQAKQADLPGQPREQDSALDIARGRYARGEISREQFEEIRRELQK